MKMKLKIISNQLFEKKKNSRLNHRRGVADIISTMLLMGVTISGATTLTYFVNDGFVSGNLEAASAFDSSKNIILLAYDTRDSSSLLTVNTIDNENVNNKFLCGLTCSVNPNAIPLATPGGTEFIILQIQNNGINSIFLEDIAINNVVHKWDSSTATIQLDASATYLPPTDRPYPADGTFSILSVGSTPIFQKDSIEIQSGQIVNLLVKLGSDDSDILLNKGIHVRLDAGGIHSIDFSLESGDAR
jgi:hypothetical protein